MLCTHWKTFHVIVVNIKVKRANSLFFLEQSSTLNALNYCLSAMFLKFKNIFAQMSEINRCLFTSSQKNTYENCMKIKLKPVREFLNLPTGATAERYFCTVCFSKYCSEKAYQTLLHLLWCNLPFWLQMSALVDYIYKKKVACTVLALFFHIFVTTQLGTLCDTLFVFTLTVTFSGQAI